MPDPTRPRETASAPAFLAGGSACGLLIAGHDWSATPLGGLDEWPQSLRTAVGIMLASPGPVSVMWGPRRVQLYNDAYIPIAADRHPGTLGRPASEGWAEAYEAFLGPVLDRAFAGETVTVENQTVLLWSAGGEPEERTFTAGFLPIRDEAGKVAGVFHPLTETTRAVLVERRQAFLLELGDALRPLASPAEIQGAAAHLLRERFGLGWCCCVEVDEADMTGVVISDAAREGLASLVGVHDLSDLPDLVAGLRAGRAMSAPDLAACPLLSGRVVQLCAAAGARSALAVPLVRDDRLTALLVMADTVPRRWSDDALALIGEAAERTWAALERARTEGALRASEARFRQFGEASSDTLWIVDATGGQLEYLSPAFEVTWGEPRAAVMADLGRWSKLVHPEDLGALDGMARLLAGERLTSEYRVVRPDGRVRHIRDVGFPILDAEGRVTRVAGIAQDQTERLAADARLRELNDTLEHRVEAALAERNMLARLVEMTDVMIMAIDLDYNILALNGANADEFERIYGVRPKAGDNMLALLSGQPEQREQVRAGWARGMQGEQVTFVETHGDPDRVRPSYEVAFRPLRNDEGEQVGVYQFVTDVTDRLRREAQLAEAQAALRQAQKMDAMGQLTGGVAHDFNNLLTPIVGALDRLHRQGLGGPRERRLVDGALQSAERAATLVSRLLAFARRQPLQPVAVDLASLVHGMADLVASTSGPRVRVEVDLAPDLPAVLADPNQVEMAILNLAVNARDAMPEGGRLTVAARSEEVRGRHRAGVRPGRYVRLSVSDTGAGMDEATLARAVEPFFSTKGIGRGTGLGLSMVHGLAAQLGGALDIRSKPGLGTGVELWLPVAPPADVSAEAKGDAGAPADLAAAGTALLVDDEDAVRASTADMLADMGFAVVEAASAEAALGLLDQGLVPDLLLTDHLMPGLTGAELARAVRARLPGLPVLVVSGYAEAEGVAPDLARLSKPFRQVDLAAALAEAAGAAPGGSPPAGATCASRPYAWP